ncbi:unnamed protein product [Urochloa humidicola]
MSSSRSRNARWWNEEDDSDVEDLLFIEGLREGSRRSKRKKFRGSLPGRHNLPRDIAGGHDHFYKDYFANNCVYPEKHFRRRFRMSKSLFLRIVAAMEAHDDYFRQKPNAAGVLGASPIQKVIAAFWMLAYGSPADFLDGYVRLGESTIIECLSHFVEAVVNVFGEEYLRAPNAKDIERLMAINSARGFPGMYGSVDCMHWKWDKCPTSWRGAYTGHKDGPTMILEAVASQDLWIWHAFFGLSGSLNDINVLRRSPLFDSLTSGTAPEVEYMVNGNKYTMGYYLADGIYPAWATFVKAFQDPQTNKKRHFKRVQEAARKDVERAFGVLQARFAIVRGPARFWCKEQLWYIMQACVVLHNMIIEDERDQEDDFDYDQGKPILQPKDYEHRDPILIEQFLKIHEEIEDKSLHEQLRDDLTEHLWALHSAG